MIDLTEKRTRSVVTGTPGTGDVAIRIRQHSESNYEWMSDLVKMLIEIIIDGHTTHDIIGQRIHKVAAELFSSVTAPVNAVGLEFTQTGPIQILKYWSK